jgi:hypothetical protein
MLVDSFLAGGSRLVRLEEVDGLMALVAIPREKGVGWPSFAWR